MYQVMIVEDDPMVAAIDKQYVEMNPAFQVVKLCKHGGEGLDFLTDHEVDLIILDYYTPSMTGLEFLERLRADGKTTDVIMVTSADDTHIVRELMARGVLDYLVKPFQSDRFQQALERFLQAHHLLCADGKKVAQGDIDRLFRKVEGNDLPHATPKGINTDTLDLIREFFRANPGHPFNGEQIAEQVSLSRITVRRYVNYMVDTGEISTSIDYQTGGRPSIQYLAPTKDE